MNVRWDAVKIYWVQGSFGAEGVGECGTGRVSGVGEYVQ